MPGRILAGKLTLSLPSKKKKKKREKKQVARSSARARAAAAAAAAAAPRLRDYARSHSPSFTDALTRVIRACFPRSCGAFARAPRSLAEAERTRRNAGGAEEWRKAHASAPRSHVASVEVGGERREGAS